MKFKILHHQNFLALVGVTSLRVMRQVDECLHQLINGRKYQAARPVGVGAPCVTLLDEGDGLRLNFDNVCEPFGFTMNGTQVFVSSAGWTVGVPLNAILKGAEHVAGKHLVYAHLVSERLDSDHTLRTLGTYVGVTKQGLLERYKQHLYAAQTGSPYRFHEALRKAYATGSCVHQVCAAGLSEKAALGWEEKLVAECSLYPRGLNMVPGGNAGLAYLRSIGALTSANSGVPRDEIIRGFFERQAVKGRPNPLMVARWVDDAYAVSVICGNPRNLTVAQVSHARALLAEDQDFDVVAEIVGARSLRVIRDLASGRTYKRVR